MTVTLYNKVHETILDVEQPLIAGQLAAIDGQLERAISELNWTSEGAQGGHAVTFFYFYVPTLKYFPYKLCAVSEPYLLIKF